MEPDFLLMDTSIPSCNSIDFNGVTLDLPRRKSRSLLPPQSLSTYPENCFD